MRRRRLPIQVMLLHEDENFLLVHTIYHDPWTWRDFYLALAADDAITRQARGRTIYRVVDLSETRFVPPAPLKHFRRVRHKWMQQSPGLTVMVTAHPLLRALGQTLSRMFPRSRPSMRHAATVEDAYALIERLTSNEMI